MRRAEQEDVSAGDPTEKRVNDGLCQLGFDVDVLEANMRPQNPGGAIWTPIRVFLAITMNYLLSFAVATRRRD